MIAQLGSLLLVEDDQDVREVLAENLSRSGYRIETSGSCGDAIGQLRRHAFDVVLCDVHLPDGDGLSVLRWCRQRQDAPAVILLTGYGTIETAVEAMRSGADDFLTKPLHDGDLQQCLKRVLSHRIDATHELSPDPACAQPPLGLDKVDLDQTASHDRPAGALIGGDPRMSQLMELVDTVAPTSTTVLIQGESGTGKTLTARAIHDRSPRSRGPFVEVSCGALSETLLESELFGHVAGAFTGAVSDRPGRFRQADGGTLFLDEIDTASPALQVRLLRAIQDREFEPVGGGRTERVDVRLIVATNKDLDALVHDGAFREDLYYRVNVITLTQPPLRERVGDIPLLVEAFRERFNEEQGRDVLGVEPEALQRMAAYRWPGNVRELVNVVERAVVLCRGEVIRCDDLPEAIRREGQDLAASQSRLKQAMADPERRMIVESLEAHGWNRQRTAAALGINRTTLYKKMKRHGITAPVH